MNPPADATVPDWQLLSEHFRVVMDEGDALSLRFSISRRGRVFVGDKRDTRRFEHGPSPDEFIQKDCGASGSREPFRSTLSLKERFGIANRHDLGTVHVFIEKNEQLVDNVTDAEKDDCVLVAATFQMRLAVSDAFHVTSGWPNFLQGAVRPVESEFALQHERDVGHLVLMDLDLRVRIELEDGVNDAVLAVNVIDIERGVLQPIQLAPR